MSNYNIFYIIIIIPYPYNNQVILIPFRIIYEYSIQIDAQLEQLTFLTTPSITSLLKQYFNRMYTH